MNHTPVDDIDKKLINLLQVDFPLTPTPFSDMGGRLGLSEAEVISRIQGLKARGIIRLIGPVVEARKLGYQTTLVAMCVPAGKLQQAETIIHTHPSISHAYEREHRFNLWTTFAASATANINDLIHELAAEAGSTETLILPALRVFKIGAYFGMGNDDEDSDEPVFDQAINELPSLISLSAREKLILNILQQDLPLISRPFTEMAASTGMDTDDFLGICRSLLVRGVLRRYSASINHRNAGYRANAMICWLVPPNDIERAGSTMAKVKQVSHCYERKTYPSWPYNLYTMVHAGSRRICHEIIDDLSRRTGLDDHLILFSTREFKKTRIKYTV